MSWLKFWEKEEKPKEEKPYVPECQFLGCDRPKVDNIPHHEYGAHHGIDVCESHRKYVWERNEHYERKQEEDKRMQNNMREAIRAEKNY